MTGADDTGAGSGVQTFSFRQFSLPMTVVLPAGLTCGQATPAVAFSVFSQGAAGCGGFHRRFPSGGAANGMPRKLHDTPLSIPWTIPFVVVARHEVWRLPSGADTNALTIMASRTSVDWQIAPS
jgi:hypothetical protein